jgi:hypothetical protein
LALGKVILIGDTLGTELGYSLSCVVVGAWLLGASLSINEGLELGISTVGSPLELPVGVELGLLRPKLGALLNDGLTFLLGLDESTGGELATGI